MSNSKQIQRAALAVAVGAVFAGAAGSASASTVLGAGASAVKNSIQLLILKDYCNAGTINFFDNGGTTLAPGKQPGGGTFRIQCTAPTAVGFTSGVDIGYDTTGGSWKAFAAVSTSTFAAAQTTANANPVATVSTTCTSSQANLQIIVLANTFTVNYYYNCASIPLVYGTDKVSFGLTDVEANLFAGSTDNAPLINNTWLTSSSPVNIAGFDPTPAINGGELAGFPQQVFGVVFGIGASPALYSALQVDQKASGLIPSTCVASGAPAGTLSVAQQACAPVITKAQYASIVSGSGGALNSSLASLFTNTVPANTSFELARRDQGSGTQASSNAFFLSDGCTVGAETTSTPTVVAGAGTNVSYNATTGNVQTKLQTPTLSGGSNFAIGVVSVENESKWTAGAGFLKLDGFYPSAANAQKGLYAYVSEENLHANPTATSADETKFLTNLTNQTPAAANVNESAYSYGGTSQAANGIVQLYSPLNTAVAYGNGASLCGGWQHL